MVDYISKIEAEIKNNPRWKFVNSETSGEYVLIHTEKGVHIHIPRKHSVYLVHGHTKINGPDKLSFIPNYESERNFGDPDNLLKYLPSVGILDPERPSKDLLDLVRQQKPIEWTD